MGLRASLVAIAMVGLVACGDKRAMMDRLKVAQAEDEKYKTELATVEKQLAETRRQNTEMETLFFSQLADPDAPPEKGPKKRPPKLEDAADALRIRVSQLGQEKDSLDQQLKAVQAEMTEYRARLAKPN